MSRHLRIAIVGAGPAGVYAADILTKNEDLDVSVDVIDRDPTPFGLIRYGVAPDHPRIKEIIKALKRVMSNERIQFFGNVNFGADLKLEELRDFYDAVIFATGARRDRELNIPGVELDGSYGAADFVYWYDGHPAFGQQVGQLLAMVDPPGVEVRLVVQGRDGAAGGQ